MNESLTKWCYILPAYNMKESTEISDFILALYHLTITYTDYRETLKSYNGLKMLDNSYWELQKNPKLEDYIDMAKYLDVDVIFTEETMDGDIDKIISSATEMREIMPDVDIMGIVKVNKGISCAMDMASGLIDCDDIKYIGVSYHPGKWLIDEFGDKKSIVLEIGRRIKRIIDNNSKDKILYSNGLDPIIINDIGQFYKFNETFQYCDTSYFTRKIVGDVGNLNFDRKMSNLELDTMKYLL